jgi:diaminohydroxyphosphoribosylaminopyrimidine deaminase/5-amino-6-(5-phosphoribosylamino)uracil reductase
LIAAGVARVVVGIEDPDTAVAGQGIARLRAAGVNVEIGVEADAVRRQLAPYLKHRTTGRPWVVLKLASTLDGRTAAPDGTSQWITSAPARTDVHTLRSTMDAIMAGVGTVLADDPQLTVRDLKDGTLAIKQPLRVVVDSHGRTPASARVRDAAAPTWIVTTAEVGAGPDGRVDLHALLATLFSRGIRSILLEGGPTLAGTFLAAGLVDQVIGYVAPKLLGAGKAALLDAGVASIDEAIELDLTDLTQIGPDLRFTASLRQKRES